MLYVSYDLSAEAVNRIFVETGKKPNSRQAVEINPETLTTEERQAIADLDWTKHLEDTRPLAFSGAKLEDIKIWDVRTEKPRIAKSQRFFNQMISERDALDVILHMATSKKQAEAELPAAIEAYEAKRAIEKAEREVWNRLQSEKMAAEKAELEAKYHAKRLDAMSINWNGDKAICNLHSAIVAAAEVEMDSRFSSNWVKEVTGVDAKQDNGYCFVGKFINDGTVEIEKSKRVFLVAGTSGSRKHNTTEYRVVTMDADGILHKSDIHTDNDTAGWSLRIRDQIAALFQ